MYITLNGEKIPERRLHLCYLRDDKVYPNVFIKIDIIAQFDTFTDCVRNLLFIQLVRGHTTTS